MFNLGTLYQAGAAHLPPGPRRGVRAVPGGERCGALARALAVAKLTLEGWDPDPVAESGGDESTRKGRVAKNCREAARLLAAFLEERLAVFSDEHEDALAALEGGFVEAAAESRAGAASDSEDSEDEETSETEVGPDPWGRAGALRAHRRARLRGGPRQRRVPGKKAGAAKTRRSWFKEKEKESAFPPAPHAARGARAPRGGGDASRRRGRRRGARRPRGRRVVGGGGGGRRHAGDLDGSGVGANSQKKRKASHPRRPRRRRRRRRVVVVAASGAAARRTSREGRRRRSSAGSSVTSETTFSSQKNATWHAWRITRLFSLRTPESESSVPEHESGLDRDAKPPAPAAPPRGFARTRRVAFHYQEASLLGLPEGSVSLAWCWSRGVGVPRRDLKQAEIALWKAHDDSADEMEARSRRWRRRRRWRR